MSDDPTTMNVAFTERERFTLALFLSKTYKPADKPARRAMNVAYKRLKLIDIMNRLSKPTGVNPLELKDVMVPLQLNTETIDWLMDKLNKTSSEGFDSIILSEIEDRLDDVKSGRYELPKQPTGDDIVVKMS